MFLLACLYSTTQGRENPQFGFPCLASVLVAGRYTDEIMAESRVDNEVLAQNATEAAEAQELADLIRSIGWYDRAKFALVRGMLTAIMRLTSLRGLYWLCCAFGTCEYLLLVGVRARVKARLRLLLGNRLSEKQISRATFRFFLRQRCDKTIYLIFDKIPKEKILQRIEFANWQHVDDALKRGQGVYIMISHYGSNYLAGLLMALKGYQIAGVRDQKEGALRRYVRARYSQTFPEFRRLRLFYADRFPRGLYRSLQQNWVVATALDVGRERAKNQGTVKINLFGQEYTFLTGTAQIALRCKAPIVQGFVASCKNFRFRMVIEEPLWDPATGPHDEQLALQEMMQRYAANLENLLQRYPCHISKF
jgi:lauroyl/myristoyl acyltransferase